jgi:hypothetical protein
MNKAELKTGIDLSPWEVNNPFDRDQYYNCDAVIEAYLKGEKDGLKNEEKVLFNQFTQNVDRTKSTTVTLLNDIEEAGFKPITAYIKFDSFDVFQALISVYEDDFIKDDFLKIYDKASEVERGIKDELYSLNFSFIPITENTIEDSIIHDGYVIRLKKS